MPAQTFLAASDFTFEPTTPKGYSSNKVDESRQDSKHNSPVSKLKLKRSQPTDIMADFLRDQDAAREGFYVVGKAEIERDGGFERVEVECMSATNGKGDLSFWEDEEDEEQWFEGWDEGGLAKSIPKVGICGQKGREVRFRSEL